MAFRIPLLSCPNTAGGLLPASLLMTLLASHLSVLKLFLGCSVCSAWLVLSDSEPLCKVPAFPFTCGDVEASVCPHWCFAEVTRAPQSQDKVGWSLTPVYTHVRVDSWPWALLAEKALSLCCLLRQRHFNT